MYKLKLYITGRTPRAEAMINELIETLDHNFESKYTLDVLDVFEHPEAAYEDAIVATPTLMKTLPEPVRKIVGDLSDRERVLAAFQVENC